MRYIGIPSRLKICSVMALALIISCGPEGGHLAPPTIESPGSESRRDQSIASQEKFSPPSMYESSGFFPVMPEGAPQRFVVLGNMDGVVRYSSGTMPAWLVGQSVFMIAPDGKLSGVPLDAASGIYLPPDLAFFASLRQAEEFGPEGSSDNSAGQGASSTEAVKVLGSIPVSISISGPASAVCLMDDSRLYSIRDGTLTPLQNLGVKFSGAVSIVASSTELVLSDSYGKIVALDSSGATRLWESAGGPVLLSSGLAIFTGADTHLQVLEAADGRFVANSDLAGFSTDVKPSRDEALIFGVLKNGSLAAMDHAGKTRWIAETGIQPSWIMNDLKQAYVLSWDHLVAFDKAKGVELWRLPLPVSPVAAPLILPGSIVFAGTDGRVYASVQYPESTAVRAADPGERVSAVIGFRLEKYVRHSMDNLAIFMPYIDLAVHEGPQAFSIFSYGPVEEGGEFWFTWDGTDRDVVLALFNEKGDELRANLDEFGAQDSFSYRLDAGGRYFIALGRQDPALNDEPLFLSVLPARRN